MLRWLRHNPVTNTKTLEQRQFQKLIFNVSMLIELQIIYRSKNSTCYEIVPLLHSIENCTCSSLHADISIAALFGLPLFHLTSKLTKSSV